MSKKMQRIWLDQARNDIRNLHNYYKELNLNFANHLVKTIFESTKILEQYPKITPVELQLKEYDVIFRSLVILKGRLKVIYYIKENNIIIAGVLDCRQNITDKIKH